MSSERMHRRRLRRLVSAGVAMVSGLAAVVAGAAPAHAATSVEVSTILTMINEDRRSAGLPPLALASDISAAEEEALHGWIRAGADAMIPDTPFLGTYSWLKGHAHVGWNRGAAGTYLDLMGSDRLRSPGWTGLMDPETNAAGIATVRDDKGDLWVGIAFANYRGDQFTEPNPMPIVRFDGPNRYHTATDVADFHHPDPGTVILVNGDRLADAVSAGPLARELGAPIVLVPSGDHSGGIADDLKQRTEKDSATRPYKYLAHADVERAIIIGGPAVVHEDWDRTLQNGGATVERIYGADRYETSAKIASRPEFSDATRFFVTTGREASLADAVSAGGAAGALGMPILLMDQSGPNATARAFLDQRPRAALALGGVLSDDAVRSVRATRISGADRYETSRLTATWAAQQGVVSDKVMMAAGTALPDALVAGALGRITLLTPLERWGATTSTWMRSNGVSSVVVVGGRTPVS